MARSAHRARPQGRRGNETRPVRAEALDGDALYGRLAGRTDRRCCDSGLQELQKVGTTDNVNVVVQIDRRWPGYSERYLCEKAEPAVRFVSVCQRFG